MHVLLGSAGSMMQEQGAGLQPPVGTALRSERQTPTGEMTARFNPGGGMAAAFKRAAAKACHYSRVDVQALFANVTPRGGKWQILTAAPHKLWLFFSLYFLILLFRCFHRLRFRSGSGRFDGAEP